MDWSTTSRIEPVLEQLMTETHGPVVADYSKVTLMDSTGLQILLRAQARLAADGRSFAVAACEWPVRNLFVVTGVDDVLRLHDSVESALASVA